MALVISIGPVSVVRAFPSPCSIFLSLGHACAGTAGYCDVFGKCRAVDAEGPLTRLKNMLLNEENIRTLTQLSQV